MESLDTHNPAGHGHGHATVGDPACARGIEQDGLKSSLHHVIFPIVDNIGNQLSLLNS